MSYSTTTMTTGHRITANIADWITLGFNAILFAINPELYKFAQCCNTAEKAILFATYGC